MGERIKWVQVEAKHPQTGKLQKLLVPAIRPNSDVQKELMLCQDRFDLAAGGWRSGKTLIQCLKVIQRAQAYPRSSWGVFRSTGPRLKLATMRTFLHEALPEEWDHPRYLDRSSGSTVLTLPESRSQIIFQALEAAGRMRGQGLDGAFVDELQENPEEQWLHLQGRMSGGQGEQWRLATCNPNGHDFIWRLWKNKPREGYTCHDMPTYGNRQYLPPGYIEEMEGIYSGLWLRKYLGGDWDAIASGLVYDELTEYDHVFDGSWWPDPKNRSWKVYAALDHGIIHPTAVVFIAVKDEYAIVFHEYVEVDRTPEEHAKALKPLLAYWHVEQVAASPDMPVLDKETYRRLGVYLTDADNEVTAGILNVKSWLRPVMGVRSLAHGGEPGPRLYFIAGQVPRTLDEASKYQWEPLNERWIGIRPAPEKPRKLNDDLMDALRYGLAQVCRRVVFKSDQLSKTEEEERDEAVPLSVPLEVRAALHGEMPEVVEAMEDEEGDNEWDSD